MCELFDYEEFYREPERETVKKVRAPADFDKWLTEKLAPPSRPEERETAEKEHTPA